MSDWLAMGGHGLYVWSSFAATLAVVVWNAVAARQQRLRARNEVEEIWDEDDGA